MGYFLHNIDFAKHNEESDRVWQAFNAGKPMRVPVLLSINPRIYLLNPELNVRGISFEQYSEDPDVMAWVQLEAQHYIRHHLLQDAEMGLPKDGWRVWVDFQNYFAPGWYGARIEYRDGQTPDAVPMLDDDNKRMLFDRGIPDPFKDGTMGKNWRFYEYMKANMGSYSRSGLPVIEVDFWNVKTDGPMTTAACLRGATELCMDFYQDPDYARELLEYVTDGAIHRIKSLRKALGMEMKPRNLTFGDDSIELLSVDMYREYVLPCHKRMIGELGGEGPHGIHLCGNVDRLMPIIKEELNVGVWDAGFPVDYGGMRKELGPEFQIQTGPRVSTLLQGKIEDVEHETRCILESGIAAGRFIMKEANNLSPCTPVENIAAMYEATRENGKY